MKKRKPRVRADFSYRSSKLGKFLKVTMKSSSGVVFDDPVKLRLYCKKLSSPEAIDFYLDEQHIGWRYSDEIEW